MKTYCSNCGHPNEYLGVKPKNCQKCNMGFASIKEVKPVTLVIHEPDPAPLIQGTNSDFDSYLYEKGEPVEPISEDEIENIFLASANRPVKVNEIIEQEIQKIARGIKKPAKKAKRATKK